jgi:hypothetical protein
MKQAVQPDAGHDHGTSESARSRPLPENVSTTGPLAQVAATMNSSPQVQRLAQLGHDMQKSPPARSLMSLAAEINGDAPPQLRAIPVNDDATLEREADAMETNEAGSNSSLVQRKTLKQAGLEGELGVVESRFRIAVKGAPSHAGIVYSSEPVGTENRESAMADNALAAGVLGTQLEAWGSQQFPVAKGKTLATAMYTRDSDEMDKSAVDTVDPFIHNVRAYYEVGEEERFVDLCYQHTADMDGYVVQIAEGKEDRASTLATMTHGDRVEGPTFPSTHQPVAGNLLEASEGSTPASFDATTKIAGEGARFVCVRNHAEYLQDDSLFCVDLGGGVYKGLPFTSLYILWKSVFKGQFNISDSAVAAKLRSTDEFKGTKRGGGSKGVKTVRIDERALAPKDYILDLSASVGPTYETYFAIGQENAEEGVTDWRTELDYRDVAYNDGVEDVVGAS